MRAVRNTETNAFRNGVQERLSAGQMDLYPWFPEERYDVIVASLYQTPVDPFDGASTHRPLSFSFTCRPGAVARGSAVMRLMSACSPAQTWGASGDWAIGG